MASGHIEIVGRGGPEVLQWRTGEPPEPGPGQVRVRVEAAGVAFAEVLMRHGLYPGMPRPPFTPGWDLTGTVDAVGPGVEGWALGDPVVALTGTGAYAEQALVPAEWLVRRPAGVDAAEAVACALNYTTAWQLLHRVARVAAGERLLVHSAAGGVGTAVLQLGRLAGLELYGTASRGKHDVVSEAGATPIDYRSEDFTERLRALGGVDVVLDPIGGETTVRSFRCLRRGGRLVCFGIGGQVGRSRARAFAALAVQFMRLGLWRMLPNGRSTAFFSMGDVLKRHPDRVRDDLGHVLGLLERGEIRPLIAERIPLREAARAHELLEAGRVSGKIVLVAA